jgi:hypothetical protein
LGVSLEGLDGGLRHGGLVHVFPGDVIACGARQMADEFTLRPTVPFAKGMQRVQFAEIVRRPLAEVGCGNKMGVMGEQVTVLADVDGS